MSNSDVLMEDFTYWILMIIVVVPPIYSLPPWRNRKTTSLQLIQNMQNMQGTFRNFCAYHQMSIFWDALDKGAIQKCGGIDRRQHIKIVNIIWGPVKASIEGKTVQRTNKMPRKSGVITHVPPTILEQYGNVTLGGRRPTYQWQVVHDWNIQAHQILPMRFNKEQECHNLLQHD